MDIIENIRFNSISICKWLQAASQANFLGKDIGSTKTTRRLRSPMSTHYATNQNNDELLWFHGNGVEIARWLLRKGKKLLDTIDEQHAEFQQIPRLVRSIVYALDHSSRIVFTILLTALLTACAFTGNGRRVRQFPLPLNVQPSGLRHWGNSGCTSCAMSTARPL